MILRITEELTDEQMAWRLKPTAPPPIGWHLWHVSRWADRLQASLGADALGIWETERLASLWELTGVDLGLLETGVLMDKPSASLLPEAGRDRILDYARRTFSAVDSALARLEPHHFQLPRESMLAIRFVAGGAVESPGAETTVAADVGFHLAHANRHLGMMEVIRGMQGLRGTATI